MGTNNGIVLLGVFFVLGKHVFVLVSGCYRSSNQHKEGSRQMGHQEARSGNVDMSIILAGNHRVRYLNFVVTTPLP